MCYKRLFKFGPRRERRRFSGLWINITSHLELLADEFKNHFLVKKDEIVNLGSDSGWHVELDPRYVKSLLDALAMKHCKSMDTRGSKKHEISRNVSELTPKLNPQEHRVPIRCWKLSVSDRTNLQCVGNQE